MERLAVFLGWIGFFLTLVGSFLPWGTYYASYYPYEIRWISGLTYGYSIYLVIGLVVVLASLLAITVKASGLTAIPLGVGSLIIIFGAGIFLSAYYYPLIQYPIYPRIQDILSGPFLTLIGGVFDLLAALACAFM